MDAGRQVRPAAAWPGATPIGDAVPARLLFVGTPGARPPFADDARLRIVAAVTPDAAAAHLARMVAVDIVWLTAAETLSPAALAVLLAAVAARGGRLVCETSLAALDAIAAAIPAMLPTELLVDPDPADRLVALAAVRCDRRLAVHDAARDAATDRIDRLQEEVARIARLLGDLAGHNGFAAASGGFLGARPSDFADGLAQLRSPPRDFALAPRSFVPEERTVQRQRAKNVRRLLRQRRMREQFFPADLFADPAWDMLLDLYAARIERQPVSVSSLCIAAAVPATTALRWIKTMTETGMFRRDADPHDGRRIFIALADPAADAMERYFEALEE